MDGQRFDTITRRMARRFNRRGALTGGVGLGTVLMSSAASSVHAQDATPVVEATPESDGTVEVLFVQNFTSGSLVADGADGADGFTLALEDGSGQTVYFSDRPERLVGTLTDAQFLDGRAFDPADPPNAAIVSRSAGGEDILVVEPTNPALDATSGAVSYTARPLDGQPEGTELASLAARQADGTLAALATLEETFGPVTLFIDQLGCIMSGSPCTSSGDCCNGNCGPQGICEGNTGPP